jgi:hypothetical protein
VGVSPRQDIYPVLLACWRVLERVPDGHQYLAFNLWV